MTDRSPFHSHARRAGEFLYDQGLCRAVLASHVRRLGKRFFYASENL